MIAGRIVQLINKCVCGKDKTCPKYILWASKNLLITAQLQQNIDWRKLGTINCLNCSLMLNLHITDKTPLTYDQTSLFGFKETNPFQNNI